jgi:hypothetical protein
MGATLSLPPSSSGSSRMDMNRVEDRFSAISNSISNLGMSHLSRHTDVIYDAIIKTMKDKNTADRNGCSEELLQIYQDKINDLLREKDNANRLMDHYYHTILGEEIQTDNGEEQTQSSVTMPE